jgi:hypothetical protein
MTAGSIRQLVHGETVPHGDLPYPPFHVSYFYFCSCGAQPHVHKRKLVSCSIGLILRWADCGWNFVISFILLMGWFA